MAVEDRHPNFEDREQEWQICSDVLRGTQAIKDAGPRYLPIPSGFADNPDEEVGKSLYRAYIERAQFPDIYAPTLRGMMGLIHRQEAVIEGLEGTPLESFHENCARPDRRPHQTLISLHQRITEQLLHKGRVGVLTDASSQGSDVPWLALYETEAITNWAESGNLYVLDESGLTRSPHDEFSWVHSKSYRVLRTIESEYCGQLYSDAVDDSVHNETAQRAIAIQSEGNPATIENSVTGPRPAELMNRATANTFPTSGLAQPGGIYVPRARGGKKLDYIPLVVGGPLRMGIDPDSPPLLGVARAALAMYQLNADYRHQLFMSGQETMYAVGVDPEHVPKVVGAGVIVGIPIGGSMGYASPSCTGIEAHAKAIADEEQRAVAAGVQLMDQGGSQQSGDALRLRYGAQTATLITVSRQSAAILEAALRNAAHMVGMAKAAIEKIIVKPNVEFLEYIMTAQDAQNLVTVWQSGAISYETLYENFVRGKLASGERTATEEQELVDQETPDTPTTVSPGSVDMLGGGAVEPEEPEDGDGTDDGPDSITDEELSATFGSFADDVVG